MKMRIVSKSGRVPGYATEGAAGFDISAFLEEPFVLKAGERALPPALSRATSRPAPAPEYRLTTRVFKYEKRTVGMATIL